VDMGMRLCEHFCKRKDFKRIAFYIWRIAYSRCWLFSAVDQICFME
jgi:ribosomal protein L37AE/L43A